MLARRVRVARERDAADDPVGGLGDEHGRVRVAADGPQVAALLRRGAPLAVGDQPALRLGADRAGELDERRRRRLGSARRTRIVTLPPPRRRRRAAGRPRPRARRRRRPRRPPLRRSRGCGRSTASPDSRPPRGGRPRPPPCRPRAGGRPRRGGRAARRSPPGALSPWSITFTTICRIAARRRIEPALPTTRRGRPVGQHDRRAPSCWSAAPPAGASARAGSGRARRACCSSGSRCPGRRTPSRCRSTPRARPRCPCRRRR